MLGQKLRENPAQIFTLFSTIIWTLCLLSATEVLWLKKSAIENVLNKMPRKDYTYKHAGNVNSYRFIALN